MPFIESSDGTELYYDDWGEGDPVVLIHGWPLNADMWSDQSTFLAENGTTPPLAGGVVELRSTSHPFAGLRRDGEARLL